MARETKLQRFQFSLSFAFFGMTVLALGTLLVQAISLSEQSEATFIVISVCFLFIPMAITLFIISTAILISMAALVHAFYRTAIKIRG